MSDNSAIRDGGSAPRAGRKPQLSPSGGAKRRPEGPGEAAKCLDARVSLRSPEHDKRNDPPKPADAAPRREAGFALVETIVSLVILTISLAVLIEIFGGGFRGIRDSEVDAAALNLARQQLALAAAQRPLRPGEQAGATAQGLQWRVVVEPYQPPRFVAAAPAPSAQPPAAYWVRSEVRWKPSAIAPQRSLSLTTLRLAGS